MTVGSTSVVLRGPGDSTVRLENFPALLGRGGAAGTGETSYDLSSLDAAKKVSRRHARLWWDGGRLLVTDLGSSNGTRVDGFSVTSGAVAVAANGSRLELGPVSLAVEVGADTSSTIVEPPGAADTAATGPAVADKLRVIREESAQRIVQRVAERGAGWRQDPWDGFFAVLSDPSVEAGEITLGQTSRVRRAGAWAEVGEPPEGPLFRQLWEHVAERLGIDPATGGSVSGILDGATGIQAFLPPLAATPQISFERLVSPLSLDGFCGGDQAATTQLLDALGARRGILVWGDDRHLLGQAADALVSALTDNERVAVVERRPTMPVRGHVTRLISADMADAAVAAGLGAAPTTLVLVDADASTLVALLQRVIPGSPRLIVAVRASEAPAAGALWPVRAGVRRGSMGTAQLGAVEMDQPVG